MSADVLNDEFKPRSAIKLLQLSKGFTHTHFTKTIDDIEGTGCPLISLMLVVNTER
jgi:hypothetical protein